jgi:hypothetical protein
VGGHEELLEHAGKKHQSLGPFGGAISSSDLDGVCIELRANGRPEILDRQFGVRIIE